MKWSGDIFHAVADPTRRGIIDLIGKGEQTVMALSRALGPTPSAISQHLKVLREAGLVSDRRVGRQRFYRLHPEPLEELAKWTLGHVEWFWRGRLGALGTFLNNAKEQQ